MNIKKIIAPFFALGILTAGCNKWKDFGDTNLNPNATTVPVTSALLTGVESGLGGVPAGTNPGFYVQYYSETIYPSNQLYSVTSVGWDAFYINALEDVQNIINTCTAYPSALSSSGNTVNQIQIARILKAYLFSIITDRFGDIPYSSALTGVSPVPYDKQKAIYTNLFKELKEASENFSIGVGTDIKGDIIYNGNLSKWKKLANSLRLIFAIKLSKVDPVTGKAEFLAALAGNGGVITDNADNFVLNYPGGSFAHPWYGLTGASVFAISNTLADKLNGYSDPRVFKYGQKNTSNVVKGVPYGLSPGNLATWISVNSNWSAAGDISIKAANSPLVIISAAYINLLRAEAALNTDYATGENAGFFITKGIQDSWAQWGVTGNITTYLTAIGVTNLSAVPIAKVQEQVWIALYASSQNAWNEWRRTNIPSLTPAVDASNLTRTIPRRYQYPVTEPNINAAAYNAAVAAFPYGGQDLHNNRVWWDKP